jgi:DNA-directed RNA polymerase subunit M/transcription elongation factor TFIIS
MDREDNIKKLSAIIDKKIATKIEESVYLFAVNYSEEIELPILVDSIYSDKFIEIFNLLINKKSHFLIDALEKEKIDVSKIAYMRPDELNPDKYETILKKKEIEDFKEKNQATTNSFKCPKCKERKANIVQKQTRSADEPASLYIECKVCGYTTIHDDS